MTGSAGLAPDPGGARNGIYRPGRDPVGAQTAEVGLMVGAAVYSGDLSPRLVNTKFIQPSLGVFYRHNFNPYWAAKGSFFYAIVSASDAESSDPYQVNRNLSFKSYKS